MKVRIASIAALSILLSGCFGDEFSSNIIEGCTTAGEKTMSGFPILSESGCKCEAEMYSQAASDLHKKAFNQEYSSLKVMDKANYEDILMRLGYMSVSLDVLNKCEIVQKR